MEGIRRLEQRPISLEEARSATEVFFVGSSLPVMPVVQVRARGWLAGRVAGRLGSEAGGWAGGWAKEWVGSNLPCPSLPHMQRLERMIGDITAGPLALHIISLPLPVLPFPVLALPCSGTSA